MKSILSISPAVDSTMTLAAALAVLVMMAALATAHPAQHKLHQVEITNFDVHSLLSTFRFPKVSMSKCNCPPSAARSC